MASGDKRLDLRLMFLWARGGNIFPVPPELASSSPSLFLSPLLSSSPLFSFLSSLLPPSLSSLPLSLFSLSLPFSFPLPIVLICLPSFFIYFSLSPYFSSLLPLFFLPSFPPLSPLLSLPTSSLPHPLLFLPDLFVFRGHRCLAS